MMTELGRITHKYEWRQACGTHVYTRQSLLDNVVEVWDGNKWIPAGE